MVARILSSNWKIKLLLYVLLHRLHHQQATPEQYTVPARENYTWLALQALSVRFFYIYSTLLV